MADVRSEPREQISKPTAAPVAFDARLAGWTRAAAGERGRPVAVRLATVQYGDFYDGYHRLSRGGEENYYGQRQTIDSMWRLSQGIPALYVSLAPTPYRCQEDLVQYYAPPQPPRFRGLPGRVSQWLYARSILAELERFSPTRLILRCNDVVGCRIMAWANRRRIETAVIVAARFDRRNRVCRRFCKLANAANVLFVGNHNRVSTETLIESGLDKDKAVAWDYDFSRSPADFAPQRLPSAGPTSVIFAGALAPSKGVKDVVEACQMAISAGASLRLTICGDGELSAWLRGLNFEWLKVTGRVSQQEVQRRMRENHLVVVPSRHDFPEGLPLVIYEALTARTPLLLSDHPVFVRYFTDGNAVKMFRAGDPASLAAALRRIIADRQGYEQLSQQTAAVWQAIQCETKFTDVVDLLHRRWIVDDPQPVRHTA